ncbi:hypothetical protein JKA74_03440 [Marivirga sp. S37H4]|uniref:Uncharacterized protein n=1 Tax=Marivirga aurantiaca TaxID=2802615 RepID=A0A934WW59_9BACT|nr:hypothetical protein [Marivirga aurantiaca]MBK6264079.1 hypothetical protein [Marivirga aurantiaca]
MHHNVTLILLHTCPNVPFYGILSSGIYIAFIIECLNEESQQDFMRLFITGSWNFVQSLIGRWFI